ncbi:transducin-like enhancer protein 6 isoform 2-T2 [Thomomys bottae]
MTSADQRPQGASIMEALVLLKTGLPRLPDHLQDQLTKHLETFNHLLKEIHQNIQEHHNQVNNFLKQMEKYNELPRSQTIELQPSLLRAVKEPESPKAPQLAECPQRPTDTGDPRSSDGLHQALGGDRMLPCLPHSQEPQFWNETLTRELFRLFVHCFNWEETAQKSRGNSVLGPSEEQEEEEEEEMLTLGKKVRFKTGQFCGQQPVSMVTKSILHPLKKSLEAQEESGARAPFLKLLTWDSEDFEDTWDRTGVEPGRSKRFAVPHKVEKMRVLKHGGSVLSAAVSSFSRHAFTCSKEGIKVWSLVGQVAEDRCPESYLRPVTQTQEALASSRGCPSLGTCLLSSDNTTLLAGGRNLAGVKLWDLSAPSLYLKTELPCPGLTCQALTAKMEESLVLAGFSEGVIRLWDLRDRSMIRDISCHPNGARSLALMNHRLWAGGMDANLHCWDLRVPGEVRSLQFNSQIMSLSLNPQGDQIILGLANGQHWLQPSTGGPAHMVGSKGGTILGVKFSPYGQWWVSVGTDDMVTIHTLPTGTKAFQVLETSCINCCTVSSNNRLVVTGSQDQATVYQITY